MFIQQNEEDRRKRMKEKAKELKSKPERLEIILTHMKISKNKGRLLKKGRKKNRTK